MVLLIFFALVGVIYPNVFEINLLYKLLTERIIHGIFEEK